MIRNYFLASIFAIILFQTTGLRLRIFHSTIPFQGLIYERDYDLAPGRCENVEKYGQRLNATSIFTENCIIAYEKINCDGHSFKVNPPGKDDLNKTLASYHACNETYGGERIQVDLYNSNETLVMRYVELCGCEAFPESWENPHSLNNHGNCVVLHEDSECKGRNKQIHGGRNEISENLNGLPFLAKAISPCDPLASCFKLSASIIGFDIDFVGSPDEDKGLTEEELAPKSTFYNNGNANTTQKYEASRTFPQTYTVLLSPALSAIANISTLPNFFTKTNASLKALTNSILPSVTSALKSAYSIPSGPKSLIDKSSYYTEEKVFSLSHSIQIPSCEKYSISSFISIYENYPIDYKAHVKITGSNKGLPIPARQLKNYVNDLDFIKELDENTSLFKTKPSKIIAKFGYETSTIGECTQIEGCKINRELDSPSLQRIVGGVKANPGEFPSQVFIRIKLTNGDFHQCSGSILNPTNILTAAHCFTNPRYDIEEASVIAGVTNIGMTRWRQTRQMDRFIIHDEYHHPTRYNNDIAIVKLTEPLRLTARVKPTRLPTNEDDYVLGVLTATGWGRSSGEDAEPEADLMKVDLSIINQGDCRDKYRKREYGSPRRVITKTNICAEAEGKGTCGGDNGGPALCRKGGGTCSGTDKNCVQCGIVSIIGHRSCTKKPSIFTRVVNYLDWIKEQMENDDPPASEMASSKQKITEDMWMTIFNQIVANKKDIEKGKLSREVSTKSDF